MNQADALEERTSAAKRHVVGGAQIEVVGLALLDVGAHLLLLLAPVAACT